MTAVGGHRHRHAAGAAAEQFRLAIEQLKYRYWRACDAKDPEGFRACFVAEGGVLDYGPLGRTDPDTMAGVFRRIALATAPDGGPRILDMHHGLMPAITVEGGGPGSPPTRATGTWTLQFRQVDRMRGTEYLATGRYDDVYVVEPENGEDAKFTVIESRRPAP